MMIDKFEE
jgi:hypothetical protein